MKYLKILFQPPDNIAMFFKNVKTLLKHRHEHFFCVEQTLIEPTLRALDSFVFLKINEV